MNRRTSATWLGAVLGTLSALCVFALSAHASDHRGAFTEEMHQTYTLSPDGRIELDNINGPVHITAWDQNNVKLDAVKYADTKERLEQVQIDIRATANDISIRTRYPDHDNTWNWGSRNNPASVEYTLMVPRTVRLDEIKLINGELDVSGMSGEVRASSINGRIEASNLTGRTELSTINGKLDARFEQLGEREVELHSVNGAVTLTLPSDAKAEVEASTVSGGINNDFGLHVNNHHFVGHDLRGELGSGGTHVRVENVNGRIDILHANDGRTMSPVRDLGGRDKDDDSTI